MFSFLYAGSSWGIDILFEKLTPEIGSRIWKTPLAHNAFRGRGFMESLFFDIFGGDLHFDALIIGLF